mmetsp:Transcript_12003/g.15018  ORF Transcript_12003/g.15018 Transcript_12003/m.15018 type:complete len:134 (-) Transcript_12003:66-467(-)
MGGSSSKPKPKEMNAYGIYDLWCYCPACEYDINISKASYWRHTRCKQRSTINLNALVGCKGDTDACQGRPFIDWYWKCQNHSNAPKKADIKFATASILDTSAALAASVNTDKYDEQAWAQIVFAINKQLKNKI